jgi:hypothetical protein
MATATDMPISVDPRRVSIPLPRPLWIGLVAVVLAVVATGLQFGLPIYRQQAAIREIERAGGRVHVVPRGPAWLDLDSTQVTDAGLVHVRASPLSTAIATQ